MVEWFTELSSKIVYGALFPFLDFFLDPSARYYWVYCMTGLAIAAFAYRKHGEAKSFRETLLQSDVWTSQSAINDYILVMLMPVLRLTVLSALVLNWKTVAATVSTTLGSIGVTGMETGSMAVAIAIVMTIALFLVDDFLRWWVHYVFHRIPELWEFHKVHHSAEHLNFLTSERHHPMEVVITGAVLTLGYGIVNGIFIAFFGDKLTPLTVAGANVFMFTFNIAGGVLRHSPFWISFGPIIERWIISPAMHHVHHSAKEEHFDRNMGSSLAVWDRWAGTIHIPKGREVQEFGIGEETRDFRSMEVILLRPFTAAAALLKKRVTPTKRETEPAA